MALPFVLIGPCIAAYQAICFPFYSITRVRWPDYIVLDRHHLGYLNSIEKLNCLWCGYANGLVGHIREIVARTQQYWCPIKHAHKLLDWVTQARGRCVYPETMQGEDERWIFRA